MSSDGSRTLYPTFTPGSSSIAAVPDIFIHEMKALAFKWERDFFSPPERNHFQWPSYTVRLHWYFTLCILGVCTASCAITHSPDIDLDGISQCCWVRMEPVKDGGGLRGTTNHAVYFLCSPTDMKWMKLWAPAKSYKMNNWGSGIYRNCALKICIETACSWISLCLRDR